MAEIGPTFVLPLVLRAPLQPPLAVQPVALVLLQVKVDTPPLATLIGFALSVTVGAGDVAVTVTEAVAFALPPAPVHVSVKLALAVNAPVVDDPVGLRAPDQFPDALQAVASVLFQVNVDEPPLATVDGLATTETVGAGGCVPG